MYTKEGWRCCEQYDGSFKIVETPTLKQWGRYVCAHCGHFIKYVEHPKLKHNHEIMVQLLEKIEQNIIVDDIEKAFIQKYINHKVLTPKQINYLKLLEKIYLNSNIINADL